MKTALKLLSFLLVGFVYAGGDPSPAQAAPAERPVWVKSLPVGPAEGWPQEIDLSSTTDLLFRSPFYNIEEEDRGDHRSWPLELVVFRTNGTETPYHYYEKSTLQELFERGDFREPAARIDLRNNLDRLRAFKLNNIEGDFERIENIQTILPSLVPPIVRPWFLRLDANWQRTLEVLQPEDFENVTSLYIQTGNIDLRLLGLERFTNLRSMNLSGNELTSLVGFPRQMNNLRLLDLACNQLRSLDGLPEQLNNLQSLLLGLNRLESLVGLPRQMNNLRRLDLHMNNLSSFREITRERMPMLGIINIAENPISTSIFYFFRYLAERSRLEGLGITISNNILDF